MMAVNRKSAGPVDDKQSLIDEGEHEGTKIWRTSDKSFPRLAWLVGLVYGA